jgi:hypothetical protein
MNSRQHPRFIFFALFNLAVVAMLGVLMRYKIGFDFPFLNQKYLLHAHSHFAFYGWVSHILYTLLYGFLLNQNQKPKYFSALIIANLVCAYGMLISFSVQGYGAVSITFSTFSIFISYFFTGFFIRALKQIPFNHPSKEWFAASLFFNVISSLGTFYLAFMMVTKNVQQDAYLGSVYFFLHFQYNGWFLFAILGLLIYKLHETGGFTYDRRIFLTFFMACIPAYFLSVLWVDLPWYLYLLPVIAVVLQVFGLVLLLQKIKNYYQEIVAHTSVYVRWITGLALMALVIKTGLQTASIFPEISKLAFGFRSVVIAYLHLVLLAFTTLFLLGYLLWNGFISHHKSALLALFMFVFGVFANEFVLMVQGVASFGYVLIPFLNEILLGVSLLMFISLIILLCSYQKARIL